jgi:hypothetical protein
MVGIAGKSFATCTRRQVRAGETGTERSAQAYGQARKATVSFFATTHERPKQMALGLSFHPHRPGVGARETRPMPLPWRPVSA